MAFPGVQVGLNLQDIAYWGTEWSFINCFRMCQPWLTQPDDATDPWDLDVLGDMTLDSNGYPTVLPQTINEIDTVVATLIYRNIEGHYPSGQYVFLYDGTGTFQFAYDCAVNSSAAGRIVLDVTPSNAGMFIKILTSNVGDPVTNIRLVPIAYESDYATRIFHPKFLEDLGPFNPIRVMNWLRINDTDMAVTDWADRTPEGYYTYAGDNGCPPEVLADLANKLNCNLWVNVPHLASNDYIDELATMLLADLSLGQNVYIAYSNEVWNSTYSAQYNWVAANTPGGAEWGNTRGIAYWSKNLFDRWMAIWVGADATRVIRVVETQRTVPQMMWKVLDDLYTELGGDCDAGATSVYFGFRADDYDVLDALGESVTVNDIFNLINTSVQLDVVDSWWSEKFYTTKGHCDGKSIDYIAYEGGQGLGRESTGTPAYLAKMADAQTDDRMYEVYRKIFARAEDVGMGVLCMYRDVGEFGTGANGFWGHKEYQDDEIADTPKYRALLAAAGDNPMAHRTLFELKALDFVGDPSAQLVGGDLPCGFACLLGRPCLTFDDTAEEAAVSHSLVMPQDYASGTLKATITFFTASDNTNTLAMDVYIEAVTPDTDTLDLEVASGWDSANSGTVSVGGSTAGDLRALTVTLTNKDSVAVGDTVRVGIRRECDGGSNISGDVYVTNVDIWEDTA